jgi:hypothetical protein
MNEHAIAADLRYNIVECHLTGKIDDLSINAQAGSGGRAGTKTKGALNSWLANNPYATSVKLSNKTPGGPLPNGYYQLVLHEARNNWIRLVPFQSNVMHGRAGFAIHGRGLRGSDGCIVPTEFNVVVAICKAIKKRNEKGGAAPVLEVFSMGDLSRWERQVA